jgi:hypothetical protein
MDVLMHLDLRDATGCGANGPSSNGKVKAGVGEKSPSLEPTAGLQAIKQDHRKVMGRRIAVRSLLLQPIFVAAPR